MTLMTQARRAGMTLAAACLGAGATMAAGALIVGLGSSPAAAQEAPASPANSHTFASAPEIAHAM